MAGICRARASAFEQRLHALEFSFVAEPLDSNFVRLKNSGDALPEKCMIRWHEHRVFVRGCTRATACTRLGSLDTSQS